MRTPRKHLAKRGNSRAASGVLLGIMLLPAIAGACAAPDGDASTTRGAFAMPTSATVASNSPSRPTRSRRPGGSIEENEYPTPATMDAVSAYLRSRSAREQVSKTLESSWNEFYIWCDSRIRRFASSYRSQVVDVDDCAQETWTELTSRLKTFRLDESRGKFASWLYALVRNKAADLSRAANRQRATSLDSPAINALPPSQYPTPLEELSQKLDRRSVRQALEHLRDRVSAGSYELVKLRWIDQRPLAEVKARLGITANQLWVREHRLREKLRSVLEANYGIGKER